MPNAETVTVYAAVTNAEGSPDFAAVVVDCPPAGRDEGAHYEIASNRLDELGYEQPYVLFDQDEAPVWFKTGVATHCKSFS